MKTRRDVLIADHDSALAQLVEEEINYTSLSRRVLLIDSGVKHESLNKLLIEKKQKIKEIGDILKIIEDLILKENNAEEIQPN